MHTTDPEDSNEEPKKQIEQNPSTNKQEGQYPAPAAAPPLPTITKTLMPPLPLPPNLKFGPFQVSNQVFHLSQSRLTYGLVNIKPILPGHILVVPVRSVPRLSQLTTAETTDLFQTVKRISRTLERIYHASALNVAVQDGVDAGQSVPHVHVHLIPRKAHDMDDRGGGDALYELMDGVEGDIGLEMAKDVLRRREDSRKNAVRDFGGPDVLDARERREEDDMMAEAEWLRLEIEKDGTLDGVDL